MVLGGWQTNGFVTAQTGVPFTPTLQTTTVNTGTGSRPNCVGSGALSSGQSITNWFDVTAFVPPPAYTYGNCGRNILFGPGRVNLDLSLFKEFHPAGEWMKMQFRAEALNAFNRVQFSSPNTSVTSSSFGRVTAQANTPRQVQFGLKFMW